MTAPKSHVLVIYIIGALNLRPADLNGFSDPFISIRLRRDDGRLSLKKWRTSVKEKTLNPEWRERFRIPLDPKYSSVLLEIWDNDHIKKDWLGDVMIDNILNREKSFDGELEIGKRYKGDVKEKFKVKPTGKIRLTWNIEATGVSRGSHSVPSSERVRNLRENQTFPKKSDRIAIIGAGPGGIHMAHVLKRHGYEHVTILEKSKRVGGKSRTFSTPEKEFGNRLVPHELGTCFLNPIYFQVENLLKEYPQQLATEITPGCQKCGDRNIYTDDDDGEPMKRDNFIFHTAEKAVLPEKFWFLPEVFQAATIFKEIKYYCRLHKKIFGTYDYTFPPYPTAWGLAEINMTMGRFLEIHNLKGLAPLFTIGHSAQGYGLIDSMPAYYALSWFSPNLIQSFLPPPFGKNPRNTELITMLKEGYETIWKEIYHRDKLNVQFERKISKVSRGDHVIIEGTHKDVPFKEVYDYLIITAPLKLALEYLENPTREEQEIFSALTAAQILVTLYTSDTQQCDQIIQYYVDDLVKRPGAIFAQRHSARCMHKLYDQHTCPKFERDTYVAYQYVDVGKTMSDEELIKIFDEDTVNRGIRNVEVIKRKKWDYFYQFRQEHINMKYPWKLWDMQGTKKTLYSGGSACFESVNDVVNYNLKLVNEHL